MSTYLNPMKRWECPNCDFKDITYRTDVHTQFHSCRGLKGLTAPMVPEGTKARVLTKEREDYVGKETVTLDGENRPIMSVVTIKDDGQDCAVMAPCAQVETKGG